MGGAEGLQPNGLQSQKSGGKKTKKEKKEMAQTNRGNQKDEDLHL